MNKAARNILYVSHTADLRGSAMSLCELIMNLDRNHWHAYVLLSKHGPFEETLSNAGIPFLVVEEQGLFKLKRIAAARNYLLQHHINLVHLNSAVPFCRDVGIAAKLVGIPVVWHIREDPKSKRVRRLTRWIRLLASQIVVVSSDLEEWFRSSGKVLKVYNGIDLGRFSPQHDAGDWRKRLGIGNDEFVFILVGTVEERKGQHLAVEAAAQLKKLVRQPFHLLIVGAALGPSDQTRLDDALDRNPQIKPIVHCVGRQSQQEVAALLAASDCLMLPSAWEGFPRTIAEAMACGLPIIASKVGEIPQMVRDEVEGWLLPAVNAEEIASTMLKFLTSANLREIGNQARKHALTWSIQTHVENIMAIYANCLSNRASEK